MSQDQDSTIRLAAFAWLDRQGAYENVLPRTLLEQGFPYHGRRVTLLGPQGIWKPKLCRLPISIATTPNSPYGDSLSPDNYLLYKYRGTDPNHPDNVGLREAGRQRVPLIYFHGVVPGRYMAAWPVFIEHDDPVHLEFAVAIDDRAAIGAAEEYSTADDAAKHRRQYITSTIKTRLHQQSFRERVLAAYRQQCSFCRLRHRELLDAAHIIPDSDFRGEPVIPNGLSLCKIHHAAFDRNFLGVTPDYQISVRADLLDESDGPMLRHGIQELHGKTLYLPRKREQRPDRDRLAARYDEFRRAI